MIGYKILVFYLAQVIVALPFLHALGYITSQTYLQLLPTDIKIINKSPLELIQSNSKKRSV